MNYNGNKFICGIRRFDKHTTQNNRPSNQQLHDETEKSLVDLIKLREQQDKGIFTSVSSQHSFTELDSSKELFKLK